jgi:aminobenzoyl-glutamate utilization protein B
MAMTLLDLVMKPEVVAAAKEYFAEQTKDVKYQSFIRPQDRPVTELNVDIMAKYREEMRKHYYDPSKYATYLEQLGIAYPTTTPPAAPASSGGRSGGASGPGGAP